MRLYRLSPYPAIDGMGGMYASGRWHTQGRRVFYGAEHPALALVEVLAHLRASLEEMPVTHRMVTIEVDDGAVVSPTPELPGNWAMHEPSSQKVGNDWLATKAGLLLPVPSAIVAGWNYVVNVAHAQASTHLSVVDDVPYWFDRRLVV